MARIAFSSTIEEILGSLAGTTFQDSYFGLQMRTRVTPKNPRSNYQMLRRGEFSYLTKAWRTLTPGEQDSWVDEAGTVPAALRLFISCNINLSLIGEAVVLSYTSDPQPTEFELAIDGFDETTLDIIAIGAADIVPAGTALLISVTALFSPARQFVNISQYSPVITFPALTDLSAATSILSEWIDRYGIMKPDLQLCISCSLINTTNGLRSANYITCAISPLVNVNTIIDNDGTSLSNNDSGLITYP